MWLPFLSTSSLQYFPCWCASWFLHLFHCCYPYQSLSMYHQFRRIVQIPERGCLKHYERPFISVIWVPNSFKVECTKFWVYQMLSVPSVECTKCWMYQCWVYQMLFQILYQMLSTKCCVPNVEHTKCWVYQMLSVPNVVPRLWYTHFPSCAGQAVFSLGLYQLHCALWAI